MFSSVSTESCHCLQHGHQLASLSRRVSLARTLGWSLVTGKNLRLKLSATKTACSGCFSSSCSPAPFRPGRPEPERLCFPPLLAMFAKATLSSEMSTVAAVGQSSLHGRSLVCSFAALQRSIYGPRMRKTNRGTLF